MNINPLNPHVTASDIAPERLANNPQLSEHEKIGEASRQFEAILLKQILDASQKTVIKSKFANDSTASSIYHDLVTTQLANSISKSGSFGLAKTFEQQLNRPTASSPKAAVEAKASSALPAAHHPTAPHEVLKPKQFPAKFHSAAHTLKPLNERTLTKPN